MHSMSKIEFIQDGPVSYSSNIRARELELSRARSFAARVSHARKERKSRSTRSVATNHLTTPGVSSRSTKSDEELSLIEDIEGLSMQPTKYLSRVHGLQLLREHLRASQAITVTPFSNQVWRTSEQRLAYEHWRFVSAPWSAQFHASLGSNFFQIVVPQLAEVFSPVKNVVLALEFIDLPAFQGETLAERREKTLGFYNEAIRSLYKASWPHTCIIMVSILAYGLELRLNHTDKARIHLSSSQKLLADANQNPQDSKRVSEFVQDFKDVIYHGTNLIRVHTRLQRLQESVRYFLPEYGINTMPDSLDGCGYLEDFLMRFQQSIDEIQAYIPSNLHSFDTTKAIHEYGRFDALVHRLCQRRKIGNTTTTVSKMLFYIFLFLIPCTQDGNFSVHPDPLVWDYILKVFGDQLLRSLDAQERQDVNMVVKLGLAAILRFPHESRHATEIGSIQFLIALGEITSSMPALQTINFGSDSSFEMM